MKKKALAAVAGPYRLMQLFWLTFVYEEYDWDVAVIRYGEDLGVVDELYDVCQKSGRFSNVYKAITITKESSFVGKAYEFIQMWWYYINNKKKVYCKKRIEQFVDKFDYDLLVVACANSIFEGAMLNFSDEIETQVLQEGIGDYSMKKLKRKGLEKVAADFLYKMQYMTLNTRDFPHYQNCTKWASRPDKLAIKEWKDTKLLFDEKYNVQNKFKNFLGILYNIDTDEKYDLIIFTSYLDIYDYSAEGHELLHKWLIENYNGKNILIKKHPEEIFDYSDWDNNGLCIYEKYGNVPGELVFLAYEETDMLFTDLSTMLMSIDTKKNNVKVCYFNNIIDEDYKEIFSEFKEFLEIDKSQIVNL